MVDLSSWFDKLNEEQREAVLTSGHTAVLAGPGSGKTATLVTKAAYLLSEKIPATRGLACITFNNEAADEFKSRLQALDVLRTSRVFLGTLHSFCLNCVLRPFSHLLQDSGPFSLDIGAEDVTSPLLANAANQVGPDIPLWDLQPRITKLRSRIACGEDTSGFGDDDRETLKIYRDHLRSQGLIDFEGIVESTLALLRKKATLLNLLSARFPWILVDEYQDLGGPLHQIVELLLGSGACSIFAVGDPDQSIYDFTGADPKYLLSLTAREDVQTIRLRFNYRSGARLIAASQAALAPSQPRDYQPAPSSKEEGEILFFKSDGLVEDHATLIVDHALPEATARGIPLDEIAIFYKRKGPFLDKVQERLALAKVPYFLEKDARFRRSRIVKWLQRLISFGLQVSDDKFPIMFSDLADTYRTVLLDAGLIAADDALEPRVRLLTALGQITDPSASLKETLAYLDRELGVSEALHNAPDLNGDIQALAELQNALKPGGALFEFTVVEFGVAAKRTGKVVLATDHSSKGRQFDAVVIPELVEQVFPAAPWIVERLRQERRLFYVAFTRAKKLVLLVSGESYRKANKQIVKTGESRFVAEIKQRLETGI